MNNHLAPPLPLPKGVQNMIFEYLNPIDSTCLGLASARLYLNYRRRFQ